MKEPIEKITQLNKYLNLVNGPKKEKLVKEKYYSFDKVLERLIPGKSVESPLTLEDLRYEQNEMKKEIQQLKQRVKMLETREGSTSNETEELIEEQDNNEFINSIEKYIKQKLQSNISLKIKDYVAPRFKKRY